MTISVVHVLGGLVAHGAELRVLELIRNSDKQQFTHYVFVLDRSLRDLEGRFVAAGAKIELARSVWHSGLDLASIVRTYKVDIVHSNVDLLNGWCVSWARLGGAKVRISHMRTEDVGLRSGRLSRLKNIALWALIQLNTTHHVGVSPSALQAGYSTRCSRSSDSRVILSGIDFARLRAEPIRLPGSLVMLHIGRDTSIKNREAAVGVLNACHSLGIDVTLYFVGETTPQRESELRSLSIAEASKLSFLGVREDVPAIVRGADVLLSTSRAEGMPGTVLEAALVGTRVVASDIPATRYLSSLLPGIHLVSLNMPNEDWAKAVEQQYRRGPIHPAPIDVEDVSQPFDARRTVGVFEALWRETQT